LRSNRYGRRPPVGCRRSAIALRHGQRRGGVLVAREILEDEHGTVLIETLTESLACSLLKSTVGRPATKRRLRAVVITTTRCLGRRR